MTGVAMEVDGADPPAAKFAFNVLQMIKTSQMQHGLRLGDYKRYRHYCNARLYRLYSSLKFKHGRGKYVKKEIKEAIVTDVRYLFIVLYSAERAWSHAMEIKSSGPRANARQQHHLLRRLTKAAKWADLLKSLCLVLADDKTGLEALAYSHQMWGNLLLEKGTDWIMARERFEKSRKIYVNFSTVGDVENQVLCRQRVEEVDSMIKFCSYEIGRSDVKSSEIIGLSTREGPAIELLQSKLEAVMAEARTQQAASMTELEFLGRKFPVKNPKTRVCILKGQEVLKELGSTASTNTDKKISLFDKLFMTYHDAKRHIRDDLAIAGTAEDVREELNGLDRAVSSILLQRTVDRNLFLVNMAKNRLVRAQKGLKEEKGEKPAKPEDLVRLYDTLIQNVVDLSELVTSGRETTANIRSYAQEMDARRLSFQAGRCYYLSQVYNADGKYPEAYALIGRAREHAESALKGFVQLTSVDETVLQELRTLALDCRAQKCLIHARAVMEEQKSKDTVQKGIGALALSQDSSKKEDRKFLSERLDVYESALGRPGVKEQPRIFEVVPSFQAIPCRPIVLDTALNMIEFPSLEGRLKKEEKRGFLPKWNLFGR